MKIKNLQEKTYHCPNCGGEVIHSYNHRCVYCGGLIDFNEPEEKTIEVKPEDLVNIQLREIYQDSTLGNIIFVFDGYKCARPKIYEYDDKTNDYISRIEEYINPPKCGFYLSIPKQAIKCYGIDYIKHAILKSGIRYSEFDNVIQQVIEDKELHFISMY